MSGGGSSGGRSTGEGWTTSKRSVCSTLKSGQISAEREEERKTLESLAQGGKIEIKHETGVESLTERGTGGRDNADGNENREFEGGNGT